MKEHNQNTSERLRVVIFGKINDAGIERLKAAGRYDLIERPDHADDRIEVASQADAIIVRMTKIDAELIDAAPNLTFVARHGVGYDTVDVEALTRRGIPLALTGDVNSGAVAEHALGLMLALAKRIPAYDQAIRRGRFSIRDSFSACELRGRTVLLVGFGRIGRKVARLCDAFGMSVLVVDPFVDAREVDSLGYRLADDLDSALEQADFVSLHVPKGPDTVHLIGETQINRMKRGAFLINVSRGGLVDETSVLAALDVGQLGGAALDVFEVEPPPDDYALLKHPGLVLTPHSAAFTGECSARMALACADNVIAFAAGRVDPQLVVNPETLGPETRGKNAKQNRNQ
jgi:D-3-phosphoglycerate dehydrogenase